MSETERRAELAANLAAVRNRIAAAAASAGRDPDSVRLIVVTKNHPASDVRLLAGLGVRDVAENRDQEAAPKAAACADLGLRWHFVGQLQSNKARSVAGYASVVHSVDRPRLVRALAATGRPLDCLIQVNLGGTGEIGPRGGADPADVPALADELAATGTLHLTGVMAVAPKDSDPQAAFDRLAEIQSWLHRSHPTVTMVSAGMSGDLEQAVAAGATHVRIGTAILGARPRLG